MAVANRLYHGGLSPLLPFFRLPSNHEAEMGMANSWWWIKKR